MIPGAILAVGSTWYMRNRAAAGRANIIERFILSSIHYCVAEQFGFGVGSIVYLQMNGDQFEKQILREVPNSELAKEIKNFEEHLRNDVSSENATRGKRDD